jgi:hypothetical protein
VVRLSKNPVKIQRRTVILLVLSIAGITAAGLAGRGSGSQATPAAGGPDSRTQPLADGCVRDDRLGIFGHKVPNWVYVGGGVVQNQVLAGVVDSKYQPEKAAEPTGTDDPLTHTSYDFTFNVKPDPGYENLLGSGNFEGQGAESERLHVEREALTFPTWGWPDRGDRVSMVGSWVWDCDHTTASGEHTEIHPFRLLWVERNPGGPSPRSPAGDRQADLYASFAGTPADTQAICANRTKGDRDAFHHCLETPVEEVPLAGTYVFVLRAGKKPSPRARLVYRVVDRFAPSVPIPVTKLKDGIRVKVDAAGATGIARQFFVGWRPVKPAARPVRLRVRLRELLVRRAMDPSCPAFDRDCPARDESRLVDQNTTPPGEWNVYVDAGGIWAPWNPLLIRASDGQTFRTKQTIDLYVAKGKPWRLFVQTRECDFGSVGSAYSNAAEVPPCPHILELGNGVSDDQPGILAVHFRSPAASLGTHRVNSSLAGSTCPASNVKGCYRLTFTISRIRP